MTATVQTAVYVFGIVPADAAVPKSEDAGLAARLRLVAADDLAALVGSVPTDRPLGRAADLRAHDRVLAAVVNAGTPVLPMRFGAVVSSEDAVVEELLTPHRAEFGEALDVASRRNFLQQHDISTRAAHHRRLLCKTRATKNVRARVDVVTQHPQDRRGAWRFSCRDGSGPSALRACDGQAASASTASPAQAEQNVCSDAQSGQ